MSSALFTDIANAPVDDPPDLFGSVEFEEADSPQRTSETRAKGKGSRTRLRECENCGAEYTGGTRLCADCRESKPRAERSATGGRGQAKLADDLVEMLVSRASDISIVLPTVAGVLIARADATVDGMLALAKGHKRTTAALQKLAAGNKAVDLFSVVALLAVALMVDLGRIPVESPLLDRVGYSEVVRGSDGKSQKDDRGMILKDRKTLRDIHDLMTGEESAVDNPEMPQWAPGFPTIQSDTGTAPTRLAPMNWVP